LVGKYCDQTPLYRQAHIFASHGVELERSTLAGWVGGACRWFAALYDWLCEHMFASEHLFADDTPIPVLDPGGGAPRREGWWCMPAIKHVPAPDAYCRSLPVAESRKSSRELAASSRTPTAPERLR
jgi:hypothetical protein